MCFQTLEHILIILFQVLVLIKIEYYQYIKEQIQLNWLLVFSPLFVQSFMAMIIAIWCMRHEKSFEVFLNLILYLTFKIFLSLKCFLLLI
jgi:hypothetical protein